MPGSAFYRLSFFTRRSHSQRKRLSSAVLVSSGDPNGIWQKATLARAQSGGGPPQSKTLAQIATNAGNSATGLWRSLALQRPLLRRRAQWD